MQMPAHHVGFHKYEKLSEAEVWKGPLPLASLRPWRKEVLRFDHQQWDCWSDLFGYDKTCTDCQRAGNGKEKTNVFILHRDSRATRGRRKPVGRRRSRVTRRLHARQHRPPYMVSDFSVKLKLRYKTCIASLGLLGAYGICDGGESMMVSR